MGRNFSHQILPDLSLFNIAENVNKLLVAVRHLPLSLQNASEKVQREGEGALKPHRCPSQCSF